MNNINLTQAEKSYDFSQLHKGPGAFVIANPWDIGSARLLQGIGFKALATTSAGYALSLGRQDGSFSCEETFGHVRQIVDATSLPVSADLENGFGDSPEIVAKTIRLAAEAGLTTESMAVMIVANRAFGNLAYCTLNEGLGKVMRFGGNDESVRRRLHWLNDVLAPAMAAAVAVLMVSSSSKPGSRNWALISTSPGDTMRPLASMIDASSQWSTSSPATCPFSSSRFVTRSRSWPGSITRPP